MSRYLLAVCVMAAFLMGGSTAWAAEVLMVTWQGDLDSEVKFRKKLSELQPGVKFTTIDAGRKKGKLAKKLRGVDLDKYDLVYSFGTTGSKIVKEFLKGRKPQVFNLVSTPVLSKIADSIEKPGVNITGARLLVNISTQLEVLTKLRKVKNLVVWFDPREKQSNSVLKQLRKEGGKLGITISTSRIIPDSSSFEKLLDEASEQANKADALYVIATSSFRDFQKKLYSKLKPELLAMATLSSYVQNGSTVALGADLGERGVRAAELANRILKGEKAGSIPVTLVSAEQAKLYVNKDKMAAAGLKDLDKMGFNVQLIDQAK